MKKNDGVVKIRVTRFPLNNPDENISATMDGTPFHYQNCVSEKKWKKIEARFDQCVRGVKNRVSMCSELL